MAFLSTFIRRGVSLPNSTRHDYIDMNGLTESRERRQGRLLMKSDLLEMDPVIRYLSKQETGAAYVTDVINHNHCSYRYDFRKLSLDGCQVSDAIAKTYPSHKPLNTILFDLREFQWPLGYRKLFLFTVEKGIHRVRRWIWKLSQ